MKSLIDKRYERELIEDRKVTVLAEAGGLWQAMRKEVQEHARGEPMLASFFHATILNHETLEGALSFHLASKLGNAVVSSMAIREIMEEAMEADQSIVHAAEIDIKAAKNRDPACSTYSMPFLYFKGFHALQTYRIAHWLWNEGRHSMAWYLQNQMSTDRKSVV